MNQDVYDEIHAIEDEDAYDITRRLAKEEGILVGPSSGGACYAALQVAKRLSPDDVVVCIACDTGERYLSIEGLFDAPPVEVVRD